jgi:hypothetical protein
MVRIDARVDEWRDDYNITYTLSFLLASYLFQYYKSQSCDPQFLQAFTPAKFAGPTTGHSRWQNHGKIRRRLVEFRLSDHHLWLVCMGINFLIAKIGVSVSVYLRSTNEEYKSWVNFTS